MPASKVTVDGAEYDFDFDSITNKEATAIEIALGVSFKRWGELLQEGYMSATTALVWTIQKRTDPALRFDAVEFKIVDLDFGDDPAPLPQGTNSDADTSESSPTS